MVNNLVSRQVDGLIVASSMLNDADYVKLSEQLPVVLFDRHISDTQLPLVITDSLTPTAELVERLARANPDEIYFLGGQPRLSPTKDRLAGFMQGLERAGVPPRPEWIIHGNYHPSSGYEMFAALCARLAARRKRCLPPPAGCWKGCCAI